MSVGFRASKDLGIGERQHHELIGVIIDGKSGKYGELMGHGDKYKVNPPVAWGVQIETRVLRVHLAGDTTAC